LRRFAAKISQTVEGHRRKISTNSGLQLRRDAPPFLTTIDFTANFVAFSMDVAGAHRHVATPSLAQEVFQFLNLHHVGISLRCEVFLDGDAPDPDFDEFVFLQNDRNDVVFILASAVFRDELEVWQRDAEGNFIGRVFKLPSPEIAACIALI
jgi:hypothetical protein